jgi:hypothetical protein
VDDGAREVVSAGGDDGQGAGDLAMHVIEEARGDDADGILPRAIRSAELRVRLPGHHIDMLQSRAHRGAVGRAAGGLTKALSADDADVRR